MIIDALKENIQHIKKIVRELYIFTNQLDMIKNLETNDNVLIDVKEKKLLEEAIISLTNQLKILNNSFPELIGAIGFYPELSTEKEKLGKEKKKLIKIKYKPVKLGSEVSLTIESKDRKSFLENISKSNLTATRLKKKYAIERPVMSFGRANAYAKISNHFFRKFSNHLIAKGHFKKLNRDLRKMNSNFVLGTYISMVFFTALLFLIISILFFVVLLFYNITFTYPEFVTIAKDPILIRALKYFWIIFVVPFSAGIFMYYYPTSESKNLGYKINQELPFVIVHMSAIATSGVQPLNIFKIILRSEEYKYTNIEIKKLMNLINFHGQDLVSALKKVEFLCPSEKLKDLLGGIATTMTSGGDLHIFLDKHAETALFDYQIEREKYTKNSETFMDIYISIAIAAPMIILMLFVIMGSTGALSEFIGISMNTLSLIVILLIVVLNVGFLMFLKLKQPTIQ